MPRGILSVINPMLEKANPPITYIPIISHRWTPTTTASSCLPARRPERGPPCPLYHTYPTIKSFANHPSRVLRTLAASGRFAWGRLEAIAAAMLSAPVAHAEDLIVMK